MSAAPVHRPDAPRHGLALAHFMAVLMTACVILAPGFAMARAASTNTAPGLAAEARAAAQMLADATRALDAAKGAHNRVKALSQAVRAYEAGLSAMREGLRRATIQEQALTRELAADRAEIAQLLGVLQSMSDAPAPVLLLHPSGPVGTARAGMILADVTPALTTQAEALHAKLEDMTMLRDLQQNAADTLQEGLHGAQAARTALSQAIAERIDLPRRFTEDPVKTALLIASSESLEGFASGLSQIATDETPGSLPGISGRKGKLRLPVQGRLLRRAGEADAAGITRPGIIMATPPRALVTTPAAATVRYRGPLLNYGNVVILEPESGILLVFAGLDVVYGTIGQVLPGGSPVGLMGGVDPEDDGIVPAGLQESAIDWTQTLYIEIRENNSPVDPALWFRTDKDD